jgi:hypothetical protein
LLAEQIDDFIAMCGATSRKTRSVPSPEPMRPSSRQHDLAQAFAWCRRVALNAVHLGLAAAACVATPTLPNRVALARYDIDPAASVLLTLPAPDLTIPIVERLGETCNASLRQLPNSRSRLQRHV